MRNALGIISQVATQRRINHLTRCLVASKTVIVGTLGVSVVVCVSVVSSQSTV